MKDNYAIIMAGGVGSRFWPLSTEEHPKQFLDVLGTGKSLIQMTFERLNKIVPSENVYVVTNKMYQRIVLEQIPQLSSEQVLCEPERKNTAPCIAYASAKIHSNNPNAKLIVSPADHLIAQPEKFVETVNLAIEQAEKNRIVTIGIRPTRPDTGYGYIEFDPGANRLVNKILEVKQFREKPKLEIAKEFVLAGNFYWNSGIFIWKSQTVLDALQSFQPELFQLFASDLSFYNTKKEQNKIDECFAKCKDISIDFAVMEHAKNIDVILSDFDWSDLGTWGSLDEQLEKDSRNNTIQGDNVHLFDCKNSMIHLKNGKQAIIEGLKNFIVIDTDEKLLILRKENEQELKQFLKSIE